VTFTVVRLPTHDVEHAQATHKLAAFPQLDADDERAAPFHRLVDAVCAGAERFALEVALAEAVSALARLGHDAPLPSRQVRRALAYLRERLAEPISLDDLAAHADVDKFHLCRAFRAQIGLPPHTYLTHLRVARAKALLARGMRASELAPLVGFYDQAQLTKHFRRVVGTTPARYAQSR
jgi:AraC-like DNA-binding protein